MKTYEEYMASGDEIRQRILRLIRKRGCSVKTISNELNCKNQSFLRDFLKNARKTQLNTFMRLEKYLEENEKKYGLSDDKKVI